MNELLEQLSEKELIKNRWYLGRGRNSNVGWWDGDNFLTIGYKFNVPIEKIEGYLEWNVRGCFQPFLLLLTLEETLESQKEKISQQELINQRWYFRNSKENYVGLWSSEKFLTIVTGKGTNVRIWDKDGPRYVGTPRDMLVVKEGNYSDFDPLEIISEGKIIEPFDKFSNSGWGKHYGKKLFWRRYEN